MICSFWKGLRIQLAAPFSHRLGIELQKFFERAQPSDARHRHIEQHDVVRTLRVSVQSFFAGLREIDAIAVSREQRLEDVAHYFFVINDEY